MRKPIPAILIIISLIAFAAIYFSTVSLNERRQADLAQHGVETSATVIGTNCATRNWVRYVYLVDGRAIEETGPAPGWCAELRAGDKLTIRYSERSPGTSAILARAPAL